MIVIHTTSKKPTNWKPKGDKFTAFRLSCFPEPGVSHCIFTSPQYLLTHDTLFVGFLFCINGPPQQKRLTNKYHTSHNNEGTRTCENIARKGALRDYGNGWLKSTGSATRDD